MRMPSPSASGGVSRDAAPPSTPRSPRSPRKALRSPPRSPRKALFPTSPGSTTVNTPQTMLFTPQTIQGPLATPGSWQSWSSATPQTRCNPWSTPTPQAIGGRSPMGLWPMQLPDAPWCRELTGEGPKPRPPQLPRAPWSNLMSPIAAEDAGEPARAQKPRQGPGFPPNMLTPESMMQAMGQALGCAWTGADAFGGQAGQQADAEAAGAASADLHMAWRAPPPPAPLRAFPSRAFRTPSPKGQRRDGSRSCTPQPSPRKPKVVPTTPQRPRQTPTLTASAASGASGDPGEDPFMRELCSVTDPNEGRFLREFCEIERVGRGDFATVYRARSCVDQQLYAVKVQKSQHTSGAASTAALREARTLATLSAGSDGGFRNIVRYHTSWVEDGRVYVQTELCGCSLRDQINERHASPEPRCFEELELAAVLKQAAAGLAALHGRGFAHLDVKPDNILVGLTGEYKLADLGLAVAECASPDDVSEGDCRYLALQVLRGDFTALPKADVFSLGIVGYELATFPEPLDTNGEVWRMLREESDALLQGSALPSLSEPMLALLRAMLHPSAAERPTSKEAASHSALVGSDIKESREAALEALLLDARREVEALKAHLALKPEVDQPATPRTLHPGHLGG